MLGSMLGTIHNLRYYLRLTEAMRDALDNGTFDEFVHDFYARRGLEVPPCPQDYSISICAEEKDNVNCKNMSIYYRVDHQFFILGKCNEPFYFDCSRCR